MFFSLLLLILNMKSKKILRTYGSRRTKRTQRTKRTKRTQLKGGVYREDFKLIGLFEPGNKEKLDHINSLITSIPIDKIPSKNTSLKGTVRDIKIDKETGELYMLSDKGELWRMHK